MLQRIKGAARRVQRMIDRYTDFDERVFVRLEPEGVTAPRGRVLLAYVVEPFLLRQDEPVPHHHTHYWESLQMARTFLELGYAVDAISYRNTTFVPRVPYDVFVSARTNFARIARQLPPHCLKIAHLDTAHWLVNNCNAYQRARNVKRRRGVALPLERKLIEQNWAIEHADHATVLGNEFTIDSYRYAGKPIHRLPIPSCMTYPAPEGKDVDSVRNRFIWFGSDGLLHKGLDLVLEAFADMPDFHLTVCGPISNDPKFQQAYHRELYELPNVHTEDWVDITGPRFEEIVRDSLGVVYASCSEGGGASVITCMQAGLVPVVSVEASVDVTADFGVVLPENSIETIQASVRELARRPAAELSEMARSAWRTAQGRYTRQQYAREFRELMEQLLGAPAYAAPARVQPLDEVGEVSAA